MNQRGAIGGVEGLAFGLLVFVVGTVMVANLWLVVDSKLATSAAAREAVRSFVEADNQTSGERSARQAAAATMKGHGVDLSTMHVVTNGGFRRCAPVQITVSRDVPTIAIPLTAGAGGTRSVSSTHSEVIDPYRSGLSGRAAC